VGGIFPLNGGGGHSPDLYSLRLGELGVVKAQKGGLVIGGVLGWFVKETRSRFLPIESPHHVHR